MLGPALCAHGGAQLVPCDWAAGRFAVTGALVEEGLGVGAISQAVASAEALTA